MLTPFYTAHFRRDAKKLAQRGYDMRKLQVAMDCLLLEEKPLPSIYKDHQLKGRWKSHRELHIEPDWLLIYAIDGDGCFFTRTGTHADLFNK